MARAASRLAYNVCFCALLIGVVSAEIPNGNPEFYSAKLEKIYNYSENARTVKFQVEGINIKDRLQIRTTKILSAKYSECKDDLKTNYNISEVWTQNHVRAQYILHLSKGISGDLFLCLPNDAKDLDGRIPSNVSRSTPKWIHQGPSVKIHVPYLDNTLNFRNRRVTADPGKSIRVMGFRVEVAYKDPAFDENGVPELLSYVEHTIRLFGYDFVENMTLAFSASPGTYGQTCLVPITDGFNVDKSTVYTETAQVKIRLPPNPSDKPVYYLCARDPSKTEYFVYQGTEPWLQIKIYDKAVPMWAAIIIILVCLSFSALFSGLNLGLMSLDRTELKILCNTGTMQERKYASVITPVRNHGNYLLCSILLGNVFVNSIFTILLDDLTSGLIAVIFSTLAIVMFGEITPQAICSRHGLAIGAKTIYITKFVMIITFPLAYPVSKFLDCALGEEIGNVYNRERLKELVKVTTGENDLDKDEVNIISGALELRKKTVADVMTRIEDVYMLDYDSVLDFETVSDIMKTGFSRVPVFEGTRQNIVTMLYIKDLAFVDPDDNTPLKTLCQFYQNPINFVFEDCTLDVMFRIFKEGNKGHMAFVQRVNSEGEGDPFYETIGLVTLEDVIEELIQAEIMDETDVFTDNRSKRKRAAERTRQDFSIFAERRGGESRVHISPQLTLAAFQYLNTSVELFHPHVISETILRRLLKQDIFCLIKKSKEWKTDPSTVIYQQGKPVDYFVLILEGRVEVTVGRENLNFTAGAFTYFGTQALVQTIGVAESPAAPTPTLGSLESLNLDSMLKHTFYPDYTVRASTEVLYVKIKRSLYYAAKRATLMEKSQKDNTQSSEQFDEEVDKLLHSLGDDEVGTTGATPRKRSSRNLQNSQDIKAITHSGSPKTPSSWNVSPPSRISPKDINGSIKALTEDDGVGGVNEDTSLLSEKGS